MIYSALKGIFFMAEHGSQERIAGGSTVEQEDERKLAEVRSRLAAHTREGYGIIEEVLEAEFYPAKPLNLSSNQSKISNVKAATTVLETDHGAHIFQVRQQTIIAMEIAPEEIEVLKKAA